MVFFLFVDIKGITFNTVQVCTKHGRINTKPRCLDRQRFVSIKTQQIAYDSKDNPAVGVIYLGYADEYPKGVRKVPLSGKVIWK